MPTETLQPKRELEVYPRVHKAGVRSINQMEVRATGGQRRGFPPEAGVRVSYGPGFLLILDPWGACLRGDKGQARVPWAWKQEGQQTEGLGKAGPPRNRGIRAPTTIPPWFTWGAQRASSGISEFAWDQTPHNNLSDQWAIL